MKTKLFLIAFLFSFLSNAQAPAWAWAHGAGGGSYHSYSNSISADANGNSYITGAFQLPYCIFGADTLSGTSGFFVVKYDNSGNVVWAKTAAGQSSCTGKSICTDASGNCYITGYYQGSGTIIFGNITLVSPNSNNGMFVVKYDSSGNAVWGKTETGGGYYSVGNGISTDANENVYVTGDFDASDPITFGTTTLVGSGFSSNVFTVKYDSLGNEAWAKSAVGASDQHGTGIKADANGNSYVTGYFTSTTLSFGSTTVANASNGWIIYVAKYDNAGNVIWAKGGGGVASLYSPKIGIDGNGNSYLTGYFNGSSAVFGTTTLTNAGIDDIFIVKYDNVGNVAWAKRAGGIDFDDGYSIYTDVNGNSYITGIFKSSITFPTPNFTTFTSAGVTDIYVVKYDSSGNALWAKNVTNGTLPDEGDGISVANGNVYITGHFFSSTLGFGSQTVSNVDISGNYSNIFVAKLDSSLVSGVNEINNSSDQFQLFPNPSNGIFTIENDFGTLNGELEIYNSLGQKIYSSVIADKQSFTVDISSQANGIYFLQIKCKEGIVTKKIMLAH